MRLFNNLDRLIGAFASLFNDTRPRDVARPSWEFAAMVVLVMAGAFLRFWGLGTWGLENDEETMAMPTLHIVEHGQSVLPSGMFYARGIFQLYMMAGSVKVFGATEWALRFPSVVCGLLLIVLVHFFGRRFLLPAWNVALVAIAAFLPAFIADSQEARMYIFMLTSLMGVAILTFEWERSGSNFHLLAAVVVMLIGLQFHVLTVFGSFIFLFPGLLHGDRGRLLRGIFALLASAIGYFLISDWVSSFYPPHPPRHGVSIVLDEYGSSLAKAGFPLWVVPVVLLLAAALAYFACRGLKSKAAAVSVAALVFAGLLFQAIVFNHVGLLMLLSAAVALRRVSRQSMIRLVPVAVLSLLLLAAQFVTLMHADVGGARKVLGAMVGLPSVWPMLRMAPYSFFAVAVTLLFLINALYRISNRQKVQDFWLFFVLCVWMPLLLLGLFSWDVEARYTEFALLPLFAVGLASLQALVTPTALRAVVPVVAAVLMINPVSTAKVVNAGYSIHPDHKGAAEFIKSLPKKPGDLVLAEDVNQQTYYLGHVDFWLIGPERAETFSTEGKGGELVDIYTATPIISSGRSLQALIDQSGRGDIYIIGSGEQQEDGRRGARGAEIAELLTHLAPEVVYHGRDGLTKVWRVPPISGSVAPK